MSKINLVMSEPKHGIGDKTPSSEPNCYMFDTAITTSSNLERFQNFLRNNKRITYLGQPSSRYQTAPNQNYFRGMPCSHTTCQKIF